MHNPLIFSFCLHTFQPFRVDLVRSGHFPQNPALSLVVIPSSESSIAGKYDPDVRQHYVRCSTFLSSIHPKLGQRVLIDPSSVVIGDVDLADDVSIWPLVAIRGDVNAVKIGARSNIQDGSVLHVTHRSEHNPDGFPC